MTTDPPEAARARARKLVAMLGGHPAGELGLDVGLGDERCLGRWLVAAVLLSSRAGEARARAAYRALDRAGLADPSVVAKDGAGPCAAVLSAAEHPDPERTAARLTHAGRALVDGYGGSLDALASDAWGLEELGARLAGLAPGIGAATVTRFLLPLRERWPAADALPLAAPAHAAARHLELIPERVDAEAAPSALRALLSGAPAAPCLADLEAALARLGARSCLRGRSERCPLGEDCPVRHNNE